jgi:hypothetical protein
MAATNLVLGIDKEAWNKSVSSQKLYHCGAGSSIAVLAALSGLTGMGQQQGGPRVVSPAGRGG